MSLYYQNSGISKLIGGGINQAVLDRILTLETGIQDTKNRLQQSEAELQALKSSLQNSNIELSALKNAKATASAYGLSKISGSTTVTEDAGLVLSAKEKNPAVNGTLANMIAKYQKPLRGYSRFSEVPVPNGEYEFFYVVYDGVDEDAPQKASRAWWWNGIVFGVPNRITQIAFSAFDVRNDIYLRQKHDSYWYGWYKITGIDV